jgi:hypothetical protein
MDNLQEGWVRLQKNPERVVCLDGCNWDGWLFMRHPDGHLVSLRKLKYWEIMQAEDQRDEGIIIDGGHNAVSKSVARYG